MTVQGITIAHARADDANAMTAFMAPLPTNIQQQVTSLTQLDRPATAVRYSDSTKCAYLLARDNGGVLSCVTFPNVANLKQASEIWSALDDLAGENERPLDINDFASVYYNVTGIEAEVIGNRH